ncbi:MAG TPA: hypothetical protein VN253_30235 [Kofleriaceae bacterium]|nr:hypothetical protein [Kofleriaceae bacterium]
MATAIRICTLGVPVFRHGGLEVGERWSAVSDLDDKQRAALRDYHGRFIQVHPDDVAKLRELGLERKSTSRPLADLTTPTPTPPAPPAPTAAKPSTSPQTAALKGDRKER